MKIYTHSQITEMNIEVLADANNDFSDEIDDILESGFDKRYPIILDESGEILDGNHRYEAFEHHNRLNELYFIIIGWEKFDNILGDGCNRLIDSDYSKLLAA